MKTYKQFVTEANSKHTIVSDGDYDEDGNRHTYGTINGKPFHHCGDVEKGGSTVKDHLHNVKQQELRGNLNKSEKEALHNHIAADHHRHWKVWNDFLDSA